MLTRDQERARLIFKQVKDEVLPLPEKERKAYGGMAHELPILIRTAGLCQALEFVETRKKGYLNLLLDHLAKAVDVESREELGRRSREDPLEQYMLLTLEALAALVWHKRFAESILNTQPGDRGVER